MTKINKSSQFKNGKFKNAKPWIQPKMKENGSTMMKFLFGGEERKPEMSPPVKQVDLSFFKESGVGRLNATWLGHSSLMVNIDGYKLLLDPVFPKKVSIFGPTRYNGEVPMNPAELPDIDVVIVSHNHYDHMSKESIRLLIPKTKVFMVPLGVGAQLAKWGVPVEKIVELDWWEEYSVTDTLMIAATPAQHFSGRSLSDRDSTLWASWVIRGPEHKVFFSGDSGYFDGFKQIGEKYGPFHMTFMECGAYNEKWHHIHMYPEETVQAHLDLKGDLLHPIHWGTFNLSIHPWYEPMERFSAAAETNRVNVTMPVVGETTIYNKTVFTDKWWRPLMKPNKVAGTTQTK